MVVPGVRELLLQSSSQYVPFGKGLQVHVHFAADNGRISHCYHTYRTLQGGPVDPVLYQDTAGWTSGSSAISGQSRQLKTLEASKPKLHIMAVLNLLGYYE